MNPFSPISEFSKMHQDFLIRRIGLENNINTQFYFNLMNSLWFLWYPSQRLEYYLCNPQIIRGWSSKVSKFSKSLTLLSR
jgi:hypothetical protein